MRKSTRSVEGVPAGSSDKSRRTYLKLLGAGGLAGLAGCQGGGSSNDGTATDSSGGDTTTHDSGGDDSGEELYGGTIRIAIPQTLNNLHPMKGVSATDYAFAEVMYSRLTVLHPDDTTAQPDLATDWEANNNVDEWTFMLNEDATFVGGDPVTASDVAATVDYMMNDDELPTADRFLGGATGADVVDEKTVTINLDGPDTEYPRRISETGSSFNIVPKSVIDDDPSKMSDRSFGSGPFTLKEKSGGNKYVFDARDDYWGVDEDGDEIPYVDQMAMTVVSDSLAATNGLVDQRYDAVLQADPTMKSRYEQGEQTQMYSHESMELINILLNTDIEPFDNPNVRKALKYAMDKEAMLEAIEGRGSLGYHHSVSPLHKLYADDIDDPFGDTAQPEKARALLEEEGYSGDTLLELPTLPFSKGSTPEKEPQAQLFQQQMAAAGIEFDLQLITTDTWLTDYWNKDEAWYFSGWAARAVETSVLELGFHSESSWNSARFDNAEYDKHLEAAMNATDMETKRKELKEAQQILHVDGPWLVTTFVNIFGAWNDYVKDVELPFTNERSYHHDARLTEDAPMGPSP
ncbi:ABC transporter substrate-binding protein [Haloarculaceae archaeon H-GB2-1]|nr:ABC transporter substrate-binding protein [Haloarculaceae archaeon H-GB2-1]